MDNDDTRGNPEQQDKNQRAEPFTVEVLEVAGSEFLEYRVTVRMGREGGEEAGRGEESTDQLFWLEVEKIGREISKVPTEHLTEAFLSELHAACTADRLGMQDRAADWMQQLANTFIQYRITLVPEEEAAHGREISPLPNPFPALFRLREIMGSSGALSTESLAKLLCAELFAGCDTEELGNADSDQPRAQNAHWLMALAEEDRFPGFLSKIETVFRILMETPPDDEADPVGA